MSSIKRNAILNTLKTVIGILFPLITFPYVSRVLNVEQIGKYNFANSIISYFSLLAALGVSTYAIREGTKYKNSKIKLEEFASEIFTLNIISTVFSYILLFLCIFLFTPMRINKIIITIFSIQIIFNTIGVNWVCNIYEDFFYITIRTIGFQILSLLLLFVFVKTEDDLYSYVLITVFSTCAANVSNWLYIKKKYINIKFHLTAEIKKHIKPIITIFWTTLTMTLYVNSDITILGVLADDYAVGLYSSAVKIYTILKNVLVAIVIVLIPRFALVFSEGDKEKTNKLFNDVLQYMILLVFPISIGLIMLSRDILIFLAGDKYLDAYISLMILSMAILFSMFAYVFVNCILIPIKKEVYVLEISVISAVVNIVLNIIFIPVLGYNVAAITTLVAEMIMSILAIKEGRKYVCLTNLSETIFVTIGGCIAIGVVCMIVRNIVQHLLVRMVISFVLSVMAYICVLLLFKNPIAIEYCKKTIKYIDRRKKI